MDDMVLYLSTFSMSVFAVNFRKYIGKHKLLYYIVVLFFPVLIATIRVDVGTDYQNYYWAFEMINDGVIVNYEMLFLWLNRISSFLFHDYHGLLFVIALITYGSVLIALEKIQSDISVSIALWIFYCFYFSASLNVMRQLIAVAVLFLATIYLNNNQIRKYFVLIVIGTLFHTSAIIGLLFWPVKYMSRKDYKLTIIISCVASIFLIFLSGMVLRILPGFIISQYVQYINYRGMVEFNYILNILPTVAIVLAPIIYYLVFSRRDNKYDFYCCLGFFSLPVLILGYHFAFFQRIVYYFDISQLIVVPLIVKKCKPTNNRFLLKLLVCLFYAFYFWFSSIFRGSNGILPYTTIFG